MAVLLQAPSSLQSSGSRSLLLLLLLLLLLRANGKGRSKSITNQRRYLLPKHGGAMWTTTQVDQD